MSALDGIFETQLNIVDQSITRNNEQKLQLLRKFIFLHIDKMEWGDWTFIMMRFHLTDTFVREFQDYLDLDFMYEWALQSLIDTDMNFMREFAKELKWEEQSTKM